VEGHSFASAAKPLSESEAGEAAGFLLETGVHTLEHGLVEYVSHSMRSKPKTEALSEPEWPEPAEPRESALPVEAEAAAPCVIANTPYNPGFWNVPAVQPKNNCYNYAMNYRSDTFAQPDGSRVTSGRHQLPVGNAAWTDKTTSVHKLGAGDCAGTGIHRLSLPAPLGGFWGHKPGGPRRNVTQRMLINGTALRRTAIADTDTAVCIRRRMRQCACPSDFRAHHPCGGPLDQAALKPHYPVPGCAADRQRDDNTSRFARSPRSGDRGFSAPALEARRDGRSMRESLLG
jgi:hypothetical protein